MLVQGFFGGNFFKFNNVLNLTKIIKFDKV